MTRKELEEKWNDPTFSRLVVHHVERYWNPCEKGWIKALRALDKTKRDTLTECWQKIAELPPDRVINFYMACICNMILSQLRKGASVIRKKELNALKQFYDTHRQYVMVKGAHGWRKHRVKPPPITESKDVTMGAFHFNKVMKGQVRDPS
jgi:hypothetical protein